MKVECIEVGHFPQPGFVQYGNAAPVKIQNTLAAQFLDHAVHMDHARPYGIGEERLSCRKAEGRAVGTSDRLHPGVQFEHEVRHAACCIPLADVADPLAEDRGLLRVSRQSA